LQRSARALVKMVPVTRRFYDSRLSY